MTDILRMTLLGGLSFTVGSEPVGRFISSKSPALLCYLAYTGLPHTRAALTGLLWGDSPETQAKASLRQVLSDLRSSCLAPYLLVEGNTVAFNSAAPHWLDVAEFNRHLQAAAPADAGAEMSDSQAAALQAAADLYRGDFLAGFFVPNAPAFEEWVTGEQEWLRQAVLQALHRLILHYTRRGAYLMGINAATRLLALEPWQEEAHRQLMHLLALNGQRGAALAQYETCRRVLAKELGVGPTAATTALYEQIRDGQVGPGRATSVVTPTVLPPTNLPEQTTSFIGRQAELAAIVGCLSQRSHRAITITGAAGIGKTRLALAAAAEVKHNYPQGIWYAPLAGVFADGADALLADHLAQQVIVDEIATALKLTFPFQADPARQLVDSLRARRILLLLDGLEPLPPAVVPFLRQLLAEADGVTLLSTAAGPLGLPGESVWTLAGLPTPADPGPARPTECASVQLFIERAERAGGGYRPGPQDEAPIGEICRLLAGNPLGIELAAAWLAHWPPVEILGALRLALAESDAPAPAASLIAVETAFQGCWDLLPPAERSALAQLTVFRGDFSEQAAEAIAGASAETLASLAERLLLQTPAPGRYAIHRLIHRFTAARLTAPASAGGRSPLIQDRHSAYYLNWLAQREGSLQKRRLTQTLAEIQTEWRHIQQAWEWAADNRQGERLQRTANALARYLALRGRYQTGERLFERAAAALAAPAPTSLAADEVDGLVGALARGQMLMYQARFLNLQSDRSRLAAVADAGRGQFEQILSLAEAEGIPELAIASLSNLGSIATLQGDYLTARRRLEAALELCEQMGEPVIEAGILSDLGAVLMLYGDYAAARNYLEQSQQTHRQNGDRLGEGMALFNLGRVADAVGLYAEAQACFEQALRIAQGLGDERLEAQTLAAHALMAHHMGDHNTAWELSDRAAQLAAAANNLPVEAEALTISGHALLGLGMVAEAATAYSHALEIGRRLGQPPLTLEPLAGLAQTALAQGQIGRATSYVDEILLTLLPPKSKEISFAGLRGAREPFRVCLTCAQALRAVYSPRARVCEEAAYRLLKERAAQISDPAMRRAFTRQVPIHREIVAAHRANRATPWR